MVLKDQGFFVDTIYSQVSQINKAFYCFGVRSLSWVTTGNRSLYFTPLYVGALHAVDALHATAGALHVTVGALHTTVSGLHAVGYVHVAPCTPYKPVKKKDTKNTCSFSVN